jgi:hypothetical protein
LVVFIERIFEAKTPTPDESELAQENAEDEQTTATRQEQELILGKSVDVSEVGRNPGKDGED